MAINFPTSLDTLTNPASNNTLDSPSHSGQHSDVNDAVEALEAKVGANSSAVNTSHDYKLSGVTGTDKAVSKTGAETLTNKTLTTPIIPSIYQDAGKTKLMTLPNTASDTLVTLEATQTLKNKTFSDAVNADAGIAVADAQDIAFDSGAKIERASGHIVITPESSKLVKIAVLRQDITTNSYANNSVILTGWGYLTTSGGDKRQSGTVSFGITFSAAPVVLVGNLGYKGSNPTAISDFAEIAGNIGDRAIVTHAYSISTTGFNVQIIDGVTNMTDGWRLGYSWIAIGVLS